MRFTPRSWKASRYGEVAAAGSLIVASVLAAAVSADATAVGGPSTVVGLGPQRLGLPLRFGPEVGRLPTGSSNELFGVFCTSPANCWAVGTSSSSVNVTRNQVLHFTGKRWFNVAVPNPAGTASGAENQLFAVRCTSASNCWAAGDSEKPKAAELDQMLHWNGRKWSVAATPTPAGVLEGDINQLIDVTCVAASNCWAVGDYGEIMPTMTGEFVLVLNQVLHWNGKTWSVVQAPNPAGTSRNSESALESIRCTSAANCWAAGGAGGFGPADSVIIRNEMLHWNGKKWFKTTVPNPGGFAKGELNELNGLACASATNCWAAGVDGNLGTALPTVQLRNDILHWNGRKWSKQTAPNPGIKSGSEDVLFYITCSSARNCWSVGFRSGAMSGKPVLNEALHWDGATWKSFSTPNPGGTGMDGSSVLEAARCTSTANCWAVGESQNSALKKNEILHWTGKKWFVG